MTPQTVRTARIQPRARVRKGRGMAEGLIYVEAYLPFDGEAFVEFSDLVKKHGGDVAAASKASPELAKKALTPVDAHGEAMMAADVMALAHRFILQSRKMDVQHDEVARDTAHVVQSFVNTDEIASPHFWPGAWVVAIKLDPNSDEFRDVEEGKLDAVSFQALVAKIPVFVSPS